MLNRKCYVNSRGRLGPTLVGEGSLGVSDVIAIGRIRKNSDLPRCARGWACEATPIDGDDEYDVLSVRKGVGFQVILR